MYIMDLEKLQELADKDLKINDTELDLESLKTPQLHNKYMKHLTKFKLMLSRAEGDLYFLRCKLIIKYSIAYISLIFFRFCDIMK